MPRIKDLVMSATYLTVGRVVTALPPPYSKPLVGKGLVEMNAGVNNNSVLHPGPPQLRSYRQGSSISPLQSN